MISGQRIIPGVAIKLSGQTGVVLDILNLEEVLIKTDKEDASQVVRISDLKVLHTNSTHSAVIPLIGDEMWEEAFSRFEAIQDFVLKPAYKRTAKEAIAIAQSLNKDLSTIYRWVERYEKSGRISSLLRKKRADVGKSRLTKAVDEIIEDTISKIYLVGEDISIVDLHEEIKEICDSNGLKYPHINTVRMRVQALPEQSSFEKRKGKKAAKSRFHLNRGKFPFAEFPMCVVQVDHTPVDVILVDPIYRLPINKAFMTIVIDVYTRMIAGFYISLEHPSSLTAGLAIAHAMSRKENYLAKMNIDTPWPIYGPIQKIHVDNAAEFRGKMLKRACAENGTILEFRPIGEAQFGGHVERAFRTYMKKVHTIPGTTFSSVAQKGDYDSEGNAIMTLDELEYWFSVFITKVYHNKPHAGLDNIPPIVKFERAILGSADEPGVGQPQAIEDEEKLKLDFTPYVERTIQSYGTVIDGIEYSADIFRPWVNARSPENSKEARKFIFARDPRDISIIYFLEPDTEQYYKIPYKNISHPPISLWELREVQKYIKEKHHCVPNEKLIFEGIREMRQIKESSAKKTKKARRDLERQRQNKKASVSRKKKVTQVAEEDGFFEDVQPFDDIEE